MRPLVVLVAALFLASRAVAQMGTTAAVDADYGFNGVQLGIPPSALNVKDLEKVEELGRWLTYRDKRDKIAFGKVQVSEVTYNFLWGKLYSIHVEVHDKRNVRGMLDMLLQRYGQEYTFDSREIAAAGTTLDTREWKGKRAYVLYKSGRNGVGAQLVVVDRSTWDKMQVPREQAAKQNREWMKGSFMNGDFDVREKERQP
jgi:hypothetical protein